MTLIEIYNYLEDNGVSVDIMGVESSVATHLATIQNATKDSIAFLSNRKYRQYLETTQATILVLNKQDALEYQGNAIISDNPHLAWAYISQLFNTLPQKKYSGIHSSAVISKTAIIHESAIIGPNAVIEDDVVIEENVYVGAGSLIESGVTIGRNSYFYANVTICYNCIIGASVTLHPGAVIGAEGFGFARGPKGYVKVAQVGRVILEDDVDIGANSCIDRGAINDTIIGEGSKIDNHVQIGHNCIIGKHTVISGFTGIAGSATIGNYVVIGGGVGMNGHITIADNVMITGDTMVTHSLLEPGVYSSGTPVMENRKWLRNTAHLQNIARLYDRVKALEKILEDKN